MCLNKHMRTEQLQDLEVLLGHAFRDREFLLNALSHSSIKNEDRPSNERLEFLGDSVLGLIVSDALYRRFPDDEGTLTRIKSQAVSRATLQRVATAMGLDRFILVGKGVLKREIPASLLGNLFEAIVGAIYLDAGLAAARKFCLRHLDIVVEEIVEDRAEKNYKSMLQHYCQRELGAVPSYRVLREAGPAHSRAFDVAVMVNGKEYGRARAQSKKEAEQGSARAAMIHFKVVRENPKQVVRGAGSILRVGPDGSSRKGRGGSRRGRGKGKKEEPEAAEAAPKKRSRRGGRRKKAASKEGETGKEAPAKKAKRSRRKKKTDASEAPAPDAPPAEGKKKRKRRRRKKKSS